MSPHPRRARGGQGDHRDDNPGTQTGGHLRGHLDHSAAGSDDRDQTRAQETTSQETGARVEIPLTPHPPAGPWHPGGGPPPWGMRGEALRHGGRRPRRRHTPQRHRMFIRFAAGLFFFVLLIGGGMALASHLFSNVGEGQAPPRFFWIARTCGTVLVIPLLFILISSRIWRSWAAPLADIMEAAEEIAAGNLQVRVNERGSRDFQRLAGSFNRMTEELARTDQQRRNLTADVAHELRTPLHIIQGNLEGILDGVYAATPEHIEATLQETRTLARLVDDLRTLSLAESGQLPLHPEIVDVQDLLSDVATSFSPQAESAGVQLCVEIDEASKAATGGTAVTDGAGLTLYGDPGRLDQVLSNLVGNALRHTPANGRITLGARLLANGAGAEDDQIELTVADTGEGMAAEDLPFIFDRFWRGDRARTHKEGAGSGLGLAIAGQLVRAHGGTITVASTLGQGTTFTIQLPVRPPEDGTPVAPYQPG